MGWSLDVICASDDEKTLGPNDIHVWYRLTESLDSFAIELASASLSEQERSRSARLHSAYDRRDYTVAHDLVRRSLSWYSAVAPAQWQFSPGVSGKPCIRNPHPHFDDGDPSECRLAFSLSHARGIVACAVSRYALLGLDVERLDRRVADKELAGSYFSPREIAALQACREDEQATRFLELWTLKEAALKATGAGLSEPLSTVCFEFQADEAIVFSPVHGDAKSWHFGLFAPSGDTRMAVAVRSDDCESPRISTRLAEGDASFSIRPLRLSAGAA